MLNTPSKIIITGPESSGKSTLSKYISKSFSLPLVKEYAVMYLNQHGLDYNKQDVINIGRSQKMMEEKASTEYPLIVCDTDGITIDIWLREVYHTTFVETVGNIDVSDKVYFLCYPDIPWEPHPMRENPTDRERLFHIQESILLDLGAYFYTFFGDKATREQQGDELMYHIFGL